MIAFLIGLLQPYLADLAWIEWSVGRFGVMRASEHATLALLLVFIPLVCGLLTARLIELRRPRRLLRRPAPRPILAGFLGLLAGVLGFALLTVASYFLPRVAESVLVAATCIAGVAPIVWLMPCRKPGTCGNCRYDLRGSLHRACCPECGAAIL